MSYSDLIFAKPFKARKVKLAKLVASVRPRKLRGNLNAINWKTSPGLGRPLPKNSGQPTTGLTKRQTGDSRSPTVLKARARTRRKACRVNSTY